MKTPAILASIFFLSFAAHGSLVNVSSIYPDESSPGRELKVSGSGFVVELDSRQFVVTASHVSRGKDTRLLINSRPLQILGRAISDVNDLEILEVQGVLPGEISGLVQGGWIQYVGQPESRERWIDPFNFVPLLDFVKDPNLAEDNQFAKTRLPVLNLDYFHIMLHGETLVQPGTSGSPLVSIVPKAPDVTPDFHSPYDIREGFSQLPVGTKVIRGMAIRRQRFFSHAAFVPALRIYDLIEQYVNNQLPQPLTEWRAQGALIFRVDSSRDLRETNSNMAATAGGTVVDSGNGVTMDGGDSALLGEETPREFLQKVSSFPVEEGRPVRSWMIVMRNPYTRDLISYWDWFDMELYGTLHRFVMALSEEDNQGRTVELIQKLYPRFKKNAPFEITSPHYLRVNHDGILIRIQLEQNDELEIPLDRDGRLCVTPGNCEAHFMPVIEVTSKAGQKYVVDLHEFFFADVGSATMPELHSAAAQDFGDDQINQAIYSSFQDQGLRPRLSYRKQHSDLTRPLTVCEGMLTTIEW